MCKSNAKLEEATENVLLGGAKVGTRGWCLAVFGEELLTKRVKTGLFILLLGLAEIKK